MGRIQKFCHKAPGVPGAAQQAAPTVDEQTAQNLVDQASDYFQVPAICILAAYDFYTGPPSPPEQNPEEGWCSAKFPNPAFWASIWNGP